jgi:hypothetical protein
MPQRYQLQPASAIMQCPNDIMDADNQKEEEEIHERKDPYNDLFLEATVDIPPKQKSNFSNSDASKKEIVHKRRRR